MKGGNWAVRLVSRRRTASTYPAFGAPAVFTASSTWTILSLSSRGAVTGDIGFQAKV